jgi:ABC-type molybdate transport system substrate-binding protein
MDVLQVAATVYLIALIISLLVIVIVVVIRTLTSEKKQPTDEHDIEVVIAASLVAYASEAKPSLRVKERTTEGEVGFW